MRHCPLLHPLRPRRPSPIPTWTPTYNPQLSKETPSNPQLLFPPPGRKSVSLPPWLHGNQGASPNCSPASGTSDGGGREGQGGTGPGALLGGRSPREHQQATEESNQEVP